MKKIAIIGLLLLPYFLVAQDFRSNANRSLFSDYKANRIGDVVTIVVVEQSQAKNSADKTAGRQSDIGFGFSGGMDETQLPTIDLKAKSNNDFEGGGATTSSGVVKTKISAIIDSVYENGLLRITGKRKIIINGEEQLVTIKGLIRSADLQTDNSVYSYKISDAEIVFEGSGMIDRNTSPGWITKLFHWLF